ncbi:hypothetical protein M422DRAFT_241976 [Sphaerobolus stellatus SS14]|nr:hypothetical protein M422DRAFT_241976 [Sphaerobolus stellatus SS14]
MSTFQMHESVFDNDEITQLKKQAFNKDTQICTLNNELLKKDTQLKDVQDMLNETMQKFRSEAARVMKLESDISNIHNDLAAERFARENMEAELKATSEKFNNEAKAAKYLQLELDSYASRTTSKFESDLKRVQQEKSVLEQRLRSLEMQLQAPKPSQIPTRLQRPATMSNAASSNADARIATLETELSSMKRELDDTSRALASAKQETKKASKLTTDIMALENARIRAEHAEKAAKEQVEDLQERLKDQEEELRYWRNNATDDKSQDHEALEAALHERDEALKNLQDARRREASLAKRLSAVEDRESDLVSEREEALDKLHRLQTELQNQPTAVDASVIEDLQARLTERETALRKARDYASQLQQLYQEMVNSCEIAEARIQKLERELCTEAKANTPLIVVSPPPSPGIAHKPFILEPQPTISSTAEQDAIVTKLLNTIERLRADRDALRNDATFARAEQRAMEAALHPRLAAQEGPGEQQRTQEYLTRVEEELNEWRKKAELAQSDHTGRTDQLAIGEAEREIMCEHIEELEAKCAQLTTVSARSSKVALCSSILLQYLHGEFEASVRAECDWATSHEELVRAHAELTHILDDSRRTQEQLQKAHQSVAVDLEQIRTDKNELLCAQDTLRIELAQKDAKLSDAAQEVEKRQARVNEIQREMQDLQIQVSNLQYEVNEAREELAALQGRNMYQEPSTTAEDGSAKKLRDQIEVLQQRVLRRTEQIGILQHDTKRLETNLRVAEETITEMVSESETYKQEKDCLVEDCAQAREARDEAHRKVEELEIQVDSLSRAQEEANKKVEELEMQVDILGKAQEEASSMRRLVEDAKVEVDNSTVAVETLVRLLAESVSKSRQLDRVLEEKETRLSTLHSTIDELEARHATAVTESDRFSSELEFTTLTLRDKAEEIETLTHEVSSAHEEVQELRTALEQAKEASSQQDKLIQEKQELLASIDRLESQLVAAQESEMAFSEQLETALASEASLKEASSQQERLIQEKQELLASIDQLEAQLVAAQESEGAFSEQLQTALASEASLKEELEHLRFASGPVSQEADRLASELRSLQITLEQERSTHIRDVATLRKDFDNQAMSLKAQVEDGQQRLEAMQDEHNDRAHELSSQLVTVQSELNDVRKAAERQASIEEELRRLVEDGQQRLEALQGEHNARVQALASQLDVVQSELDDARTVAETQASIEEELRRLKAGHAEEILVLRSKLVESETEVGSLRSQLQAASENTAELETEVDNLVARYEATQVELRGIEQTLSAARSRIDDQDAKIHAYGHEKKTWQLERTQMDAELDRLSTKYQYAEQQAKRSEHDALAARSEAERVRAENVRLEQAAQAAEINLMFKANQLEQKISAMQREAERHQSHARCESMIEALKEQQKHLEDTLGMRNAEIEEKDDRCIELLKEEKRLKSKLESLTRKVQTLQTKLASRTSPAIPPLPTSTSVPSLTEARPKTPAQNVIAGSSARPTRIPSSPGSALRSKTPEPGHRSQMSSVPMPPVPNFTRALPPRTPEKVASVIPRSVSHFYLPQTQNVSTPDAALGAVSTPQSKKRPLPEDFAASDRATTQAMIEPGVRLTPRLRKRTSDLKGGFTPARASPATVLKPAMTQPSPIRRSAPLGEATNSPRESTPGSLPVSSIGLGKPSVAPSKPSRSWLSRTRTPSVLGESRAVSSRHN